MELPRKKNIIDFWGVCERIKEMAIYEMEIDGTSRKQGLRCRSLSRAKNEAIKEAKIKYPKERYQSRLRLYDKTTGAIYEWRYDNGFFWKMICKNFLEQRGLI